MDRNLLASSESHGLGNLLFFYSTNKSSATKQKWMSLFLLILEKS